MGILNYILAGYPLLWVESFEELRTLQSYCKELDEAYKDGNLGVDDNNKPIRYKTYSWDSADGIREVSQGQFFTKPIMMTAKDPDSGEDVQRPTFNITDPLIWMENEAQEHTIMFLKDYHPYLSKDFPESPRVIRKLRNVIQRFKAESKTLVILSPLVRIPDEIEKEITKISFLLPDRDELRLTLKSVCKASSVNYPKDDEGVIDSALGMTSFEAENAFSVSIVESSGHIDESIIRREKAAIVEKTALLEVVNTTETLDSIGGNENLKAWLTSQTRNFTEEARAFGVKPPKGMLLVGVPGCGKSLAAKVTASTLRRPCLRLDVGKVFDKFQGESEAKLRRCLAIAEAVAPSVLWIDELEKSFSGTSGSDSDGHGTTKRVFSSFLNWMQEKKADVFIVATANNVNSLPEELYRPGRINVIFWVGVPDATQRQEILGIHLKKSGRDITELFTQEEVKQLVDASNNFSGAGLETWVENALAHAYASEHEEVEFSDFMATVGDVIVVNMDSKNMKDAQVWADKNKVKQASIEHKEEEKVRTPSTERKIRVLNNRPGIAS